jgi:molybdate transport system substrate-binding protein
MEGVLVRQILPFLIIVSLVLAGCMNPSSSKKPNKEITISAAASLADAMGDIANQFTKKTGIKVNINLGSSGSLEEQIEQGAPSDLFISASKEYITQLEQQKLVNQKDGKSLLTNQLVLVVPKSSKTINTINDLKSVQRIAIGTPEIVPAGLYAKESLISLHLWQSVKPNLIYGKDVRQVLSFVETGNVDAGIVYKSDALISPKVKIVSNIPSASHKPIIYPFAVMKSSSSNQAAQKMVHFLQSKEAGKIFIKYGFQPVKRD